MEKLQYEKLTWPEVQQAVAEDKLILIPMGAIEQHGLHLPLDTDVVIAREVCMRAAKLARGKALVMPPIMFGFEAHHMDFPGTINISWDNLVRFGLDITSSLAHHGFKRMLLVNGHGSNTPLVEMIARMTVIQNPGVLCAGLCWWQLEDVRKVFNEIRETELTSHGCELETSAYLAIDESLVQMELATRDTEYRTSTHVWRDLAGRKPNPEYKNALMMMEFFSTMTKTGVRGDATRATKEKGEKVLDAAGRQLADIIDELRQREIRLPVDRRNADARALLAEARAGERRSERR